jgi:hypothetical protein
MARRRGHSEPAFGSDSFLDVIANLVGIVLIIIVLVGARIRSLPEWFVPTHKLAEQPQATLQAPEVDTTQEEQEIAQARAAIAALQQRLAENLRRNEEFERQRQTLRATQQEQQAQQASTRQELAQQRANHLELQAQISKTELDQRPLRERVADLDRRIKGLETRPPERRQLRYHLPVSKPLGAGELFFECRQGRVSFIDLQSLLDEVRRVLPEKAKDLGGQWELTDEAGPIGAFKLRYTLARQRYGPLDQTFVALPPVESRGFGYGLDSWEVVPVWAARGEALQDALTPGSRFREVVDASDPQVAALTFFVYPDSFDQFRSLREHLHDRGFVVAGRPLLMEAPIAGSRQGSISRGQ